VFRRKNDFMNGCSHYGKPLYRLGSKKPSNLNADGFKVTHGFLFIFLCRLRQLFCFSISEQHLMVEAAYEALKGI